MARVKQADGTTVRELVASGESLVLDFYADWCAPCRAIGPALGDLAESYAVRVLKVDVDENGDLAEEFDVQSIPTVVRIDSGKEYARSVGVATSAELAVRLGLEGS